MTDSREPPSRSQSEERVQRRESTSDAFRRTHSTRGCCIWQRTFGRNCKSLKLHVECSTNPHYKRRLAAASLKVLQMAPDASAAAPLAPTPYQGLIPKTCTCCRWRRGFSRASSPSPPRCARTRSRRTSRRPSSPGPPPSSANGRRALGCGKQADRWVSMLMKTLRACEINSTQHPTVLIEGSDSLQSVFSFICLQARYRDSLYLSPEQACMSDKVGPNIAH